MREQRLVMLGICALIAGCDGSALATKQQEAAIRSCQESGMLIRVYYSTLPEKIWRVECAPVGAVDE